MKKDYRLVKRYARALYKEAGEKTGRAIRDLSQFYEFIKTNRLMKSLFSNPFFKDEERVSVLGAICDQVEFYEKTGRFMRGLIKNRHLSLLPEIIDALIKIYYEANNIARVIVITPIKLDMQAEERLKESLKVRLGRDVVLDYRIDTTVIGGLKVQVENTVLDTTIKGELGLLKASLLRG
ncbi:MAG: ATP synthase F1 subunit delta [Candidatus Magnetoovum sp. WYHC-5]|nr:ATP synthase F1 subunit delta [Candidatus Magnetoovum sp. WYHC-5]